VLGLGAVTSVSRTAMLMLATVLLLGLWIRPRETMRIWLALIPAALLLYLFIPAAGESLKQAFSPEGGLVAEQHGSAGSKGSGRLADVAPALEEFSRQPILGQGYGSRDVDNPSQAIAILDNQWLGTLLETGAVGLLSLLWLLIRFLRRAGVEARRDAAARGSLLAALATAAAAYGVGMLTFDSFSFIQVTFVFFILLGLGSALLAIRPEAPGQELPRDGRASHAADRGDGERAVAL
jgi:O-antigen ligase